MFRILYKSFEAAPLSHTKLKKLLDRSRQRNAEREVSGILLYDNGAFLQLLEGEMSAVRETFGRIERDPRHKSITVLFSQETASQRVFGKWPMGFADGGDAAAILKGFLNLPHGLASAELDRNNAIRVLEETVRLSAAALAA